MRFSFCLSLLFLTSSIWGQLHLKPKSNDAFVHIGLFYMPDDGSYIDPVLGPYRATLMTLQTGYFLTRRIAVGLHYVNARGGRSSWPDSVYHFGGTFVQYDLRLNDRYGMDFKFLQAVGNLCPCTINNAYEDIDPFRSNKTLFYLGFDVSMYLKLRKNIFVKIGLNQLNPLNDGKFRSYATGLGYLGLGYNIPHKQK
jgi:hypothetical protein